MKIPGIGEVKPVYVVGVAAAGLGVVGYAYYRNKKANAATATATPAGVDPSQIDPATGLPYSEEQGAYDAGAAYTPYGGIDPATGIPYIDETGTLLGQAGTSNPIANNTEWSQTAQQELENTFGYDSGTSQSAVRKYLGQHDQLTATEASAIQTVLAEIGTPPTGGPYRIIVATTPAPVPGPVNATVPRVVGWKAGDAHNAIVKAKLVPIADPGQKAFQKVKSTSPAGGKQVPVGTRVLITT